MKPYSILNNLVFLNIVAADESKLITVDVVKIKDKVVTKFNKALELGTGISIFPA